MYIKRLNESGDYIKKLSSLFEKQIEKLFNESGVNGKLELLNTNIDGKDKFTDLNINKFPREICLVYNVITNMKLPNREDLTRIFFYQEYNNVKYEYEKYNFIKPFIDKLKTLNPGIDIQIGNFTLSSKNKSRQEKIRYRISILLDISDLVDKIKISDIMKNINDSLIYKDMKYLENYKIFEKKSKFVNFRTFDLERWYDKLNKRFFSGKLKEAPMRWNTSKTQLGVVKWEEKSGKIDHLGISSNFKLTEEELLSVLAHEMVHIWQVQDKKTDSHGTHFQKKMEEINKKSKWGIKVLTKQPMSHLKMINPDLDKDYGFIIIQKSKDEYEIAVFDPKKVDYKNLLTILKQNLKKNSKLEVEIRSTQNGVVKQFEKESSNSNIVTYKVDELTFNTLMNDSKKITGHTIK